MSLFHRLTNRKARALAQVSKERGDNAVMRLMRRLDEIASSVAEGIENEWNVSDEETPDADARDVQDESHHHP